MSPDPRILSATVVTEETRRHTIFNLLAEEALATSIKDAACNCVLSVLCPC